MSLDTPPTMIYPLDVDFNKVEASLAGEIPTDPSQVAELKVSSFWIADFAEVPDIKKNAFRQIAFQHGNLSSLYAKAKTTEGND